jgi:hypothetical protein
LACFKKTFVSHVWHKQNIALFSSSRNQFSKIKRRTAGYQPAMSAKREHLSCGSPHASKGETLKIRSKKPGTTKSHERTRNAAAAATCRQLFDDSMAGGRGGMGIFPIVRGFLDNDWFAGRK